jgi:hypothetical protein
MSLKLSSKGMLAMNGRRLSFASVREQENSRHAVAGACEFLTADSVTRLAGARRSPRGNNQHSAPYRESGKNNVKLCLAFDFVYKDAASDH